MNFSEPTPLYSPSCGPSSVLFAFSHFDFAGQYSTQRPDVPRWELQVAKSRCVAERFPDTATFFGCGLPHPSIAAHQGGHFFKIIQRERRRAQGLHGNAHELHRVVVCRHPVGAELSAAFAAVDDGPLATLAYPDLPVSPQVPVQICCVSKSSPLKSLFIMRSGKVIFFAHFLLTCSVPCDIFITQDVRNFSPHFIVWYIFIHKKGTFL